MMNNKVRDLQVALLAEGVDRNTKELYMSKAEISRPPRRGRG